MDSMDRIERNAALNRLRDLIDYDGNGDPLEAIASSIEQTKETSDPWRPLVACCRTLTEFQAIKGYGAMKPEIWLTWTNVSRAVVRKHAEKVGLRVWLPDLTAADVRQTRPHWDNWTVENARTAIAKVEAELQNPNITAGHHKTCVILLRMAKAAEQRCLEREA